MMYKVSNINFDKRTDLKIPIAYANPVVAEPYLRTLLFTYCEVTFELERLECGINTDLTYDCGHSLNHSCDLIDKADTLECLPVTFDAFYPKEFVVIFFEKDLEDADNDLELAVYQSLMYCLPVHFMYTT